METTDNRYPDAARQNPLTFYLRTLLYMFMALVIRAVAFLPLSALFLFPEGSPWRWLTLLCPVLLIFFVLPLRFSFAQALVQAPRARRFSFDVATSVSGYGRKLGEALVHALNILKWGIPLWLMLGAAYYFYTRTDAITLMKGVEGLGAGVVAVWCAFANFFITLVGGTALVPNGALMEGLISLGALLGLGGLILLWGTVRNSAFRYIWAQAMREGIKPRAEARRRLTGRRWKQLLVALLNLVLWAPTLFVVFTTLRGMLSSLSNALFHYVATQQLNLPELSGAISPLIFAFLVCYMPLLPVRRILTAFFATKRLRHAAPEVLPETGIVQPDLTQQPETVAAIETLDVSHDPEDKHKPEAPSFEPVAAYTPAAAWIAPVAKPEPVLEQPAPVAVPEPVAEESAPVAKPEPVLEQPAPVAKPEPVLEQPAPVDVPEPIIEESAPVEEPESVAEEPVPVFQAFQAYQPEPYELPADEDDYAKPAAPTLVAPDDATEQDAQAGDPWEWKTE